MTITYYGHSCFKLKGKRGSVVLDPFGPDVGLPVPSLTADIVTVSHQHTDHNNVATIKASARRNTPFVITQAGEYEVGGISVFGTRTFHDAQEGAERGENIVFTVLLDGIRVCHLGDLGHLLDAVQLDAIGSVDVLLCPVGGVYTVDPVNAIKVIRQIEPAYVIPMHYKTAQHSAMFDQVAPLSTFLKEYGMEPLPVGKLEVSATQLPEETELVVCSEMSAA